MKPPAYPTAWLAKVGAEYAMEWPHVRQVARLALRLFDKLADSYELTGDDRRVLWAAAWLHDIAYARDPKRHATVGAALVGKLEIPGVEIPGLDAASRQRVAQLVAGHGMGEPAAALMRDDAASRQTLRLLAMLRVADGLDHGHVQDTMIRQVRVGDQAVVVTVRNRWYAGNVDWALRKAAPVWEAAFGVPLRIDGGRRRTRPRRIGRLLSDGDRFYETARLCMVAQLDVMRDQVAAIVERADEAALHDYRIALRRLRMALKLFRPPRSEGADRRALFDELEEGLAILGRALGGVRDAQVGLGLLDDAAGQRALAALSGGRAWRTAAERAGADWPARLRGVMQSPQTMALVDRLRELVRVTLPVWALQPDQPKAGKRLRRRLARQHERVRTLLEVAVPEEAVAFHALRKQVRRLRYYAEYADALPGGATKQTRRLRRRANALGVAMGMVRDWDRLAARLRDAGLWQTPVSAHVAEQRARAWRRVVADAARLRGV
jgi:CHAD domain-containing protein